MKKWNLTKRLVTNRSSMTSDGGCSGLRKHTAAQLWGSSVHYTLVDSSWLVFVFVVLSDTLMQLLILPPSFLGIPMRNRYFRLATVFFTTLLFVFVSTTEAQQGDELDREISSIIKNKCVMCHDSLRGGAGGGVSFLADLKKLSDPASGYIDEDSPETESYLAEIIANEEMPKPKMGKVEWSGKLSDVERKSFVEWIHRGGASDEFKRDKETKNTTLIDDRDILKKLSNDLGKMAGKEASQTRFLTLCHLRNDPNVSDEDLAIYRFGIEKTLNSLSSRRDLVRVTTDKTTKTIIRFNLQDVGWTAEDWERIVRHYPYGIRPRDANEEAVQKMSGTVHPYVRADWFVFAVTQPPLYHELVGIPRTLSELATETRVGDLTENIKDYNVERAGFNKSGVSANNRVVERHESAGGGYFWLSYDFSSSVGKQDIFKNPFGPAGAFDKESPAFRHAGGEVIYSLANGMQGYAIFDAKDQRLDVAPNTIVFDNSMVGGQIINGISCMSCHDKGMKPENAREAMQLDTVRDQVAADRNFPESQRDLVKDLYSERGDFARKLRADKKQFQESLRQMKFFDDSITQEPIRAVFDRFTADVTIESAAADFGMTKSKFLDELGRDTETRQLGQRLVNEGIKRPLYVNEFKRLVQLTGYGEVIDSKRLATPFFNLEAVDKDQPLVQNSVDQADVIDAEQLEELVAKYTSLVQEFRNKQQQLTTAKAKKLQSEFHQKHDKRFEVGGFARVLKVDDVSVNSTTARLRLTDEEDRKWSMTVTGKKSEVEKAVNVDKGESIRVRGKIFGRLSRSYRRSRNSGSSLVSQGGVHPRLTEVVVIFPPAQSSIFRLINGMNGFPYNYFLELQFVVDPKNGVELIQKDE